MKTGKITEQDGGRWRFEGFVLDPGRRVLENPAGQAIRLPARAFDVLLELVRASGRPVGKDELLAVAWKGRIVEENSLSRAVSTLRQALGDSSANPRFIATIPGEGYQFIAPTEHEPLSGPEVPPVETPRAPRAAEPAPDDTGKGVRRGALVLLAVVVAVFLAARFLPERRATVGPAPTTAGLADLEVLTDFPGSHSAPALSPDGRWLAFTSDASGANQVWVMSLEDRLPRQLTRDETGARDPAWSPDGTALAVVFDGRGVGLISPLDPGAPEIVIPSADRPAFGPGGQWIVYELGRELWRARRDGSDATRIEGVPERGFVHTPALPTFAPSGGEIAYFLPEVAMGGDFWRIPIAGGDPIRITSDTVPAHGASWLPGGDALVVSSTRSGQANLWRVPLDGTEPTALTSGVGDDTRPVVSLDGKWVVYAHQDTTWQLVSSDPNTGEHDVLLERRDPIMLPVVAANGRDAAYFSADPTGAGLFTVDLASGSIERVFEDHSRFPTVPAWSGDGGSIYYFPLNALEMRRVDVDGRNDALVATPFHWTLGQSWLSFQPDGDRYLFAERQPETGRVHSIARSLSGDPDIVFGNPEIRMPSWSPDGTRVAGVGPEGFIWICQLVDQACERVLVNGEPVGGAQPKFSRDGERLFLRRRTAIRTEHEVWRADPAAGTLEQVLDIGPIEANSTSYAVADGDRIIWARMNVGQSAIWRGRLPEGS